ncbi:MAG: hypothetical protein SF052_07590 [Bacteroidia bacterium]|nr:hypothetical protein [Bacteroidia bacterium]
MKNLVLIFLSILWLCATNTKLFKPSQAKTCKLKIYVANQSTIDSIITVFIAIDSQIVINEKVVNPHISSYWEEFSVNLRAGKKDFTISIENSQVKKDTSIQIYNDIEIFVWYIRNPNPQKYFNPKIYQMMADSSINVRNYKLFVDSLYQNKIIENSNEPLYKEEIWIKVKE